MSFKMRHFDNPFDDYSFHSAAVLTIRGKLNPNCKIATGTKKKWEKFISKFQQLDYNNTSVYTGTAGIALLKLLKDPNDKRNLWETKQLLCLNKLKNRKHTFLCGDVGPLAIGAVVCDKLQEKREMQELVKRLLSMKDVAINCDSDLPNEYLYGRAGYLFALLYVNKNIDPSPIPTAVIRQVIDAILSCGKAELKTGICECPLMYQWHDCYYLGAAHGISGILYILLQAREYLTEDELTNLIQPTIDYLATLKYESGNYPSSLERENDKYVQWCHGAPGFVYLFSMAYKVYGNSKYLKLALDAGDVIWQRGLVKKGYSMCHGVAGNAYPFLELYQTTQDERHLYRAIKFAEWCLHYTKEHEQHYPDHPLSLFEGITGPMYLLLDIQNPSEAKFPGFTL